MKVFLRMVLIFKIRLISKHFLFGSDRSSRNANPCLLVCLFQSSFFWLRFTSRILREHKEIEIALREHSESTQRALREHSESTQRALREH